MFQIILRARQNYLMQQYTDAGHCCDKIKDDVGQALKVKTEVS